MGCAWAALLSGLRGSFRRGRGGADREGRRRQNKNRPGNRERLKPAPSSAAVSLRWHYPGQVRGVFLRPSRATPTTTVNEADTRRGVRGCQGSVGRWEQGFRSQSWATSSLPRVEMRAVPAPVPTWRRIDKVSLDDLARALCTRVVAAHQIALWRPQDERVPLRSARRRKIFVALRSARPAWLSVRREGS